MSHFVIIGAGPAGVIAAETLRKLDKEASITLIGDEAEPPYSRMAIPYFMVKDIAESGTYLRKTENYFQSKHINVLQRRVNYINSNLSRLTLDNGEQIKYDKLLIATGSHPVSPPIPGIDLPRIHHCWTLSDARNIAAQAFPGSKIVLMGAGFIGCIILEALVKSGADLTVVEMEDRMVPRMMNEKAGQLIKQWCINKGVKVYTSTRITAIADNEVESLSVILENNEVLQADMVVSATGVKSNIGFLKGSGINIDAGIVINRHMQTNVENIYAAGSQPFQHHQDFPCLSARKQALIGMV